MSTVSRTGATPRDSRFFILWRVLPLMVAITLAAGLLRFFATDAGLVSEGVGVASTMLFAIVALALLAFWTARRLQAAEADEHGSAHARGRRAATARGAAPPGAEDGGGRSARRRCRARLQQSADRDLGLYVPARRHAAVGRSGSLELVRGHRARPSVRRRSPPSCSRSAGDRCSSRTSWT